MNAPDDLSALYSDDHLAVVVTSYGDLHHDAPTGTALRIDTRSLRNPPEDPAVRERMLHATGLDPEVRRYVMATPGAREIVDAATTQTLLLLQCWGNPRFRRVDVHTVCGGGRHRSVAIAEEIATHLRAHGVGVEVEHRHIDRPIVQH